MNSGSSNAASFGFKLAFLQQAALLPLPITLNLAIAIADPIYQG